MSKKKVVRTYFSKKQNKWITKEYTYESKRYSDKNRSVKNPIIVNKKGKVNKKNRDAILNSLSATDKIRARSIIGVYDANNQELKLKTLMSKLYTAPTEAERKLGKMLINMGFTPSEFVKEYGSVYGFGMTDLTNAKWEGDTITISGTKYKINFNYFGSGVLTVAK